MRGGRLNQVERTFALHGGLDIVTPAMARLPGSLVACKNYEGDPEGYRRVQGRERFDGRPAPSGAVYALLSFENGDTAILAGDVIEGATSGASAFVLQDVVPDAGSFGGGDASGVILVGDPAGNFGIGEDLEVSAVKVAEAVSDALVGGAETPELEKTYRGLAVERRRALIGEVPGSGPVRGVAALNGSIYAFRDNVGGTAGVMHKATAAGWVAQSFGHVLTFDAGSAEFTPGETVTGGTSGATATIERIGKLSGAAGGTNDLAGFLVLSGVTGTFQDNEALTDGAGGAAFAVGAHEAITLPPGGRYRSQEENFYGQSGSRSVYFVNGVGYAHEWNGTVLSPIRTGLAEADDKPTHLAVYSKHLFLGYSGGSVINTGIGEPLDARAVAGAAETALGVAINGMAVTNTSIIITGSDRISYMTGSSAADFRLLPISGASGAVAETFQLAPEPVYLDQIGVRKLAAAQTFGNWRIGTLTQRIEPLVRSKRDAGVIPVASIKVRGRDAYRIFFNDGSGLALYFGRKDAEAYPFEPGFTPFCAESLDDAYEREVLFAGDSDSGFVYQLDSGTSFDGGEVDAYFRLAFFNDGQPNVDKRWHRALFDINAGRTGMEIATAVEFGYGDPDLVAGPEAQQSVSGSGGFWDEAIWDLFVWSAPTQGKIVIDLEGLGPNCAVAFLSSHTYEDPHVIPAGSMRYSPRRIMR